MKRFEQLKDIFFQEIEQHCHGIYKQRAYDHSLKVCTLCQVYATTYNLDVELASVIGLFHDIAYFVNHSSFDHGMRSAQWLKRFLIDFSEAEVKIIVHAIESHSNKKNQDDPYSELIKNMDLLAKYYDDPQTVFKDYEQARLLEILSL